MKDTKVTLLQVIILIIVAGVFATRLYRQIEEERKPRIYTGALQGVPAGQNPFRMGPNGRRGPTRGDQAHP